MKTPPRWAQALAGAALTALAGAGHAHELTCNKTVNDQSLFQITSYPTTLHYKLTVTNTNPTDTSVALGIDDALLATFGFSFSPPPPISLPVGMSVSDGFDLVVQSAEQCARIADTDTSPGDLNIDNILVVTWDNGSAQCSARVVCAPVPPPPGAGATRTMGFWKTHETALQECLNDGGTIDLGFVKVSTLSQALGVLWGSPVKFAGGTVRSTLDKDRFLLGRQTLAGICNQREFGTTPTPPTLLSDAVAALAGTDCASIMALESAVDAFNNSGDSIGFPSGFVPGPATPQAAMKLASDPTLPSNQSCNP